MNNRTVSVIEVVICNQRRMPSGQAKTGGGEWGGPCGSSVDRNRYLIAPDWAPSRPCLHPLYCLYPPLLLDPTGSDLGFVSERQLRNSRNSAFVQVCRILRIRSTRMRTATSHNWGKGPAWLRLRLPGRLRPSQARSLTSHDHYSRDVQWIQPLARWRAGRPAGRYTRAQTEPAALAVQIRSCAPSEQ